MSLINPFEKKVEERKKFYLIAAIFLASTIFAFHLVSAMTVIANDYPSNVLGTGMATSDPSNFEVSLTVRDLKFLENQTLAFDIDLMERLGTNGTSMYVDYSITNQEQSQIFSQIETKSVQGNLSYEKEIPGIKFPDGQYTLVVSAVYGSGQLKRIFAVQRFKVENGELQLVSRGSLVLYYLFHNTFLMIMVILIILLLLSIPITIKALDRKYHRKSLRIKHHLKKKLVIPLSVNMIDSWNSKKHNS